MPKYLNENEVGFDPWEVGFPNLGACMGIVALTDRGLYGFHAMPKVTEKHAVFAQFIATIGAGGNLLRLYGSSFWPLRYNLGTYTWQDEMRDIASAIGFHGKVKGLDTSKAAHAEKRHDHCNYVEYRLILGARKCEIYYKKMDKMQKPVMGVYDPLAPVDVRWTGGNRLRAPQKDEFISSVDVIRTAGNKGAIHHANVFGMHSFDIP